MQYIYLLKIVYNTDMVVTDFKNVKIFDTHTHTEMIGWLSSSLLTFCGFESGAVSFSS